MWIASFLKLCYVEIYLLNRWADCLIIEVEDFNGSSTADNCNLIIVKIYDAIGVFYDW